MQYLKQLQNLEVDWNSFFFHPLLIITFIHLMISHLYPVLILPQAEHSAQSCFLFPHEIIINILPLGRDTSKSITVITAELVLGMSWQYVQFIIKKILPSSLNQCFLKYRICFSLMSWFSIGTAVLLLVFCLLNPNFIKNFLTFFLHENLSTR